MPQGLEVLFSFIAKACVERFEEKTFGPLTRHEDFNILAQIFHDFIIGKKEGKGKKKR